MCTIAGGIMPLNMLDGKPIKDVSVGPITQRIWYIDYNNKYSFNIK